MLVSTHNLGSVPEFCDRTVLVDATPCWPMARRERCSPRPIWSATFGGVLRHLVFDRAGRRRPAGRTGIITDDERPFVLYGDGDAGGERRGGTADGDCCSSRSATATCSTPCGSAALVGAVCAFLSAYLMLKGWSLIGDALSHSIVPGVAGAYMLGLPFSLGAFFSGGLAAGAMLFLNQRTKLKEDAVIGLIFTSFFGLGLFMVSLSPTSVNIQTIILGNILAITPEDTLQLAIIGVVSLAVLLAQVEGPDGGVLRREPCPHHRPQPDRC